MSPEVSQQQATEEQEHRAIASTAWSFQLSRADGLHVKVKYHHREDDHEERQDEARPGFHLTLEISIMKRKYLKTNASE